jgi:hypothetical protein
MLAAGRVPFQQKPQADVGPFPQISQPGGYVALDAVA